MRKANIFYIDPQSYNNLSIYDRGVLSLSKENVYFFGNALWDIGPIAKVNNDLCFNYGQYKNPVTKSLSYVKSILHIVRKIYKLKPKVVHIQWLKIWLVDWLFLCLLKFNGIKVVFTAHNVLPHDSNTKYLNKYKKYYRKVDAIITHSENTKKELINYFSLDTEKINVIPHGPITIEEDPGSVRKRKNEIIDSLQIADKIIVTSLGIQSPYKGTDILLEVWKDKFSKRQDCCLIIAGKNQGIDYSMVAGVDNIFLIDEKLSNLDFKAYLLISSVIVLPYRKISQSGVLFLSIENNIPVLVSNAGGLEEPLKVGKVGWSLGSLNYENLSESLSNLMNDPNCIEEVRNNREEFEKVKNYYSWEKISSMTNSLYLKLLTHE